MPVADDALAGALVADVRREAMRGRLGHRRLARRRCFAAADVVLDRDPERVAVPRLEGDRLPREELRSPPPRRLRGVDLLVRDPVEQRRGIDAAGRRRGG